MQPPLTAFQSLILGFLSSVYDKACILEQYQNLNNAFNHLIQQAFELILASNRKEIVEGLTDGTRNQ